MIELKSKHEIETMRRAGQVVAECHRTIARMIRPGVTTMEINRLVESIMASHGARPFQIGYKGYQYATCASVNDVIAHGFPSDEPLKEGDIVTIDTVAELDGWLGDSAWTYAVGRVSPEAERLMRVTRECLELGIAQAKVGNRLGDIAHAIQTHAERHGFGVVRDLLAHGIGRQLHEEPGYMHVGKPGNERRHGVHHRADAYGGHLFHDDRRGRLDRAHAGRQTGGPVRACRRHHGGRTGDPDSAVTLSLQCVILPARNGMMPKDFAV
jgi:methionine aminopeptidase, type I